MADERDLTLAKLAVEAGFLTREEAQRYWQQLQAPDAPRLIPLLLQTGRLAPPDVDRLRQLWQQRQGGELTSSFNRPALPPQPPAPLGPGGQGSGAFTRPSPPPQPPAPLGPGGQGSGAFARPTTGGVPRPTAPVGPAPPARIESGAFGRPVGSGSFGRPAGAAVAATPAPAAQGLAAQAGGVGEETGSWDDALARDAQLARVLLGRGLTTQERLRECRQLQVQHQARLGPILVRKGYVDRAAVEEAIAAVKAGAIPAAPMGSGAFSLQPPAPGPAAFGQPVPGPGQAPPGFNPFASVRQPTGPAQVYDDPDAMPTLTGDVEPIGLPSTPTVFSDEPPLPLPGRAAFGASPADAAPTLIGGGVSVEELNPFAVAALAQKPPPRPGPATRKGGVDAVLSVDELNAFDDVPLAIPDASAPAEPAPAPGGAGSGWGADPAGRSDEPGAQPAAPPPKPDKPTKRQRPAPEPAKGKGLPTAAWVLLAVVVLGGVAAGAYFLVQAIL